jgi:hypothetical protein
MKFDFRKTLQLAQGALFSPEATWTAYLAENPPWKQTALLLTGPLLLAYVVITAFMLRDLGGGFFEMLVRNLVITLISLAIAVGVFNFLAGTFKGKPDFSRAFAAISLAVVPAWVGGTLAAFIPWVGWLLALAATIWSIVLIYKVMPLALGVPDNKRVVQFVLSLVAIIAVNIVLGMVLRMGGVGPALDSGSFADSSPVTAGGMVGNLQRQAALMESASADRFDPPADGKVTEKQTRQLASVLEKSNAIAQERAEKFKKMSEDMEGKDKPSAADIARMYQGVGSAMTAGDAEMEIVKTGGGNWAEHQWVKEQLRVAHVQQGDGSDAIAHNYALYQQYRDALEDTL